MLLITSVFCFRLQNSEIEICAEQQISYEEFVGEENITKADAKLLAQYQVQRTSEKNEGNWSKSTTVSNTYKLYNEKDEVIAYAVELSNSGKEAGYVVVGANEENSPIIEFKTSGKFLKKPLDEDEHIIYDGVIDYYRVDEETQKATNIENQEETVNVDQLQDKMKEKSQENNDNENVKKEWKSVKKEVKIGNSTPPKSGEANVAPWNYESGYKSRQYKTVPDATFYSYFVTTNFGPGAICVPTAACNLLKYYMCRQRMKTSLILNNDWQQTFNRLKTYFKTTDSGTYMSNVKPGLDKYFNDLGIQDAVTHYYGFEDDKADWQEMKRRIDLGDPFLYATSNHFYYKEHTVFAVGYEQYNYSKKQLSGLTTSNYLQVADGWTDHADRYINVNVGNQADYDEMVTLYFVYSYNQK